MIKGRDEAAREAAMRTAEAMAAAALTAPKAHGIDNVLVTIIDGEDKHALAEHMRDLRREGADDFFDRDAGCIDAAHCVVILAVRDRPIHLNGCGYCGHADCDANRAAGSDCAFNLIDLGIAIGSAVSVAADNRIDNRVLFSAGKGAMRMNLFDEKIRACLGIPLYTGAKSIFFDR